MPDNPVEKPLRNSPEPPRPHPSAAVRLILFSLGSLFVLLGFAGVVLPVLPTTPFLLLAAACYARASTRFHRWLHEHPLFGPTLESWRRHRSLPPRTKRRAVLLLACSIGFSIVIVPHLHLRLFLFALGVALAVFLLRLPQIEE